MPPSNSSARWSAVTCRTYHSHLAARSVASATVDCHDTAVALPVIRRFQSSMIAARLRLPQDQTRSQANLRPYSGALRRPYISRASKSSGFCSVSAADRDTARPNETARNGCPPVCIQPPHRNVGKPCVVRSTLRFIVRSNRRHSSRSDTYLSAFQRALRQSGLGRAGSDNACIDTALAHLLQVMQRWWTT